MNTMTDVEISDKYHELTGYPIDPATLSNCREFSGWTWAHTKSEHLFRDGVSLCGKVQFIGIEQWELCYSPHVCRACQSKALKVRQEE